MLAAARARPRRAAGRPGHARLGGAATPATPASPPRDPEDFARLLTALVARYGPNGSLWAEHPEVSRQPIRAWQIWNEPNLTRYWNVAPWAPSYVALLKRADRALKAADPGSKTVLAGLPNESWKAVAAIYDAGARGAFDIVALHPYTGKPEERRQDREDRPARDGAPRRRQAAGLGHRALVAGGAGQDAAARRLRDDRAGPGAPAQGRAAAARRRSARKLRIGRVYWYTWLSAEGITDSAFDYSGLRRLRGGQLHDAPSLAVFTRLARRLQGCAKRPGDALRCR